MNKKRIFGMLLMICFFGTYTHSTAQNNIAITDETTYIADPSAMLDVYSVSKGMLVPRMTSIQILFISNPATGLLVFNSDEGSFWFYNGTIWVDLSSDVDNLWGVNPSTGDVYLNDLQTNIGIGTSEPVGKLSVVGNPGSLPDNPLFEIKDEFGNPIFSVTSEGVRVYVKEVSKGASGGFAVGKYGVAKGIPDTTFFVVTPDSSRIYTSNSSKGSSGGFAVGKYGVAKGLAENYMHLTENNYFIGHRAGDSIVSGLYNTFFGYESGINTTSGSHNVFMGYQSGYENQSGGENIFIGYQAGYNYTGQFGGICIGHRAGAEAPVPNSTFIGRYAAEYSQGASNGVFIGANTGQFATGGNNTYIGTSSGKGTSGVYNTGTYNVFLGNLSGSRNTTGDRNLIAGWRAGDYNTSGDDNVFLGYYTGRNNTQGYNNTFVGTSAGYDNQTGYGNIFLGYKAGYNETGSNKLYIENSDIADPLIYGDFSSDLLQFNANVGIGKSPSYKLDILADAASSYAARFHNDGNNANRYGIIVQAGTDDGSGTIYLMSFRDGNGSTMGYIRSYDGVVSILAKSAKNNQPGLKNSELKVSDILNKIQIVDYYPSDGSKDIVTGFSGENLLKIFPDATDYDPENGEYFTNYDAFIPILTKAYQEQEARILKLEKENEALKIKIEEIIRQLKK